MPDRAAHERRAVDNEQFVEHRLDMRVDVDRSWMVAALFYAALHWVEAYFAATNLHGKTHPRREQMIIDDPGLDAAFFALYKELSDESRDARYELKLFAPADIRDLQTRCLGGIKKHIASLLP